MKGTKHHIVKYITNHYDLPIECDCFESRIGQVHSFK